MKKTIAILAVMASGVASAYTDKTLTSDYTIESGLATDTRLIIQANQVPNFTLTSNSDATIYGMDINSSSSITSTTFNIHGTLTATGYIKATYDNADRPTTYNLYDDGALVVGDRIELRRNSNTLTLNTTSDVDKIIANNGLSRTLVSTVNGIWNGAFSNKNITLSDANLAAAGFTNRGVIAKTSAGTYVDIDNNVVTLGAREYALVLSRTDDADIFSNAPTTLTLLVTPEPATATLSLLALAGLAARRRRH